MQATRREFMAATAGVATAMILNKRPVFGEFNASAAVQLRDRKDVSTLNAQSPDIVSLKAGVAAMRQLPAADCRNWENQAQIHGDILGDNFNHCQHGNWWFAPWHRLYIYYFEEIIRQMSGNESFALPYWDWSKDFTLPAVFWGNGNPLDNPSRPGKPGSGRRIAQNGSISLIDQQRFVNQTVISRILRSPDFATFGGDPVAAPGDSVAAGQLEGTPHNFIHRWVGGDMVTAGSPYDPIFWLHHCNVDRLWTEWILRHPTSLPNDNTWLNAPFANHFCDRTGGGIGATSGKPITTREVLQTDSLGYKYDNRPNPVLVKLPDANLLSAITGPVAAVAHFEGNQIASFKLTSENMAVSNHLNAAIESSEPFTARVRLKGVKVPMDRDVAIEVFINCKKLTPDTPISDASYVTSVTFFHGHGHHDHTDHKNAEDSGSVSFLIDAAPALARLYGDRPFKPDEPLNVALVTKPLFPDAGHKWTGDIQQLSPTQVSIDLIEPKA